MRTTGQIRARDGWLLAAAAAGLIGVALAVQSRPATVSGHAGPLPSRAPRTVDPTPVILRDGTDRNPGHSWSLHVPWHLLGELLLIAIVAVIAVGVALVVRQVLRNRLSIRRTPAAALPAYPDPVVAEDLATDVRRAFDQAWDGLRGGDARAAVIACWVSLEQIAQAAGFVRLPADTATDLGTRLLSRLPLDTDALQTLTELYREARFSTHPMTAGSVATARQSLAALRAELSGAGR